MSSFIKTPVVEFSAVTVDAGSDYETGLWNSSFTLDPGELLLVRLEPGNERFPLADAAEGLALPSSGQVNFLGDDWQNLSPDNAATQRGKIGRLFEDDCWMSDLEVDQNIILGQRHHTDRSENEILDEALKWARVFGLPGLPRGYPGNMRRWDLRKAACIRAFLGEPALIILEQPTLGAFADLIEPLVNAVRSARQRGAAVLWTLTDPVLWNHPGIPASARVRMFGSQIQPPERP